MLIDEENVVSTIRTLHQTSINQRAHDLTEYLIEVFQSIEEQQDKINLFNLFSLFKNLLRDYDDRAALKIEFLNAKCLETIDRLLINQINNQNNITSILQFIAELLVNSENAQQNFFFLMVIKTSFNIFIMLIPHRWILLINYLFL